MSETRSFEGLKLAVSKVWNWQFRQSEIQDFQKLNSQFQRFEIHQAQFSKVAQLELKNATYNLQLLFIDELKWIWLNNF